MSKENTAKTYLLRYEPAKHEGVANWRNHEFTYFVETTANVEDAFFFAHDLDNDYALKRFNADRVTEIITITE